MFPGPAASWNRETSQKPQKPLNFRCARPRVNPNAPSGP